MTLPQRKIPILPTVNDTPSVNGQANHPNSALLCKNYNDLIDNELTILSNGLTTLNQSISSTNSTVSGINNSLSGSLDSINILSNDISNVSSTVQGHDAELQAQSESIDVTRMRVENIEEDYAIVQTHLADHDTRITTLESSGGGGGGSSEVTYIQQAGQYIGNLLVYASLATIPFAQLNSTYSILIPYLVHKKTRLDAFTYNIPMAFSADNSFALQLYQSDIYGMPSTPIRNIIANAWDIDLTKVGTFIVPVPELESIIFEKGETLWGLFRFKKGTSGGTIVSPNTTVGVPVIFVDGGIAKGYISTEAFDMNVANPMSGAVFGVLPNTLNYPFFTFRTIEVPIVG